MFIVSEEDLQTCAEEGLASGSENRFLRPSSHALHEQDNNLSGQQLGISNVNFLTPFQKRQALLQITNW